MAGDLYLVAREETREVLGVPATTTRVPGAKPWIRGLANVRGQLLPIVDLRQFLGSGITPVTRNTRVVVVNHREIPAGLLVREARLDGKLVSLVPGGGGKGGSQLSALLSHAGRAFLKIAEQVAKEKGGRYRFQREK